MIASKSSKPTKANQPKVENVLKPSNQLISAKEAKKDISLEQLLKELESTAVLCPDDSPAERVRSLVSNIKVRCVENATGGFRIHLSTNKIKADFSSQLHRICNGIIIDFPSCEVIAYPTHMPNPRFKMSQLVKNLDAYDIYEALDGTILSLYFFEERWRFSTTNGFEVNDYLWIGPPTFEQEFTRLAKSYPEFSLDKLEKNKSYTFGMRSHSYHPLKEDLEKLWLITIYNRKTKQHEKLGATFMGISHQMPMKVVGQAGPQELVSHLKSNNDRALTNFMRTKTTPAYGYILRTRASKSETRLCDILYESSLLTFIRKTIYDLPKVSGKSLLSLTHEGRLTYAVFRGYLTPGKKAYMLVLYPEFGEMFKI